MKRFNLTEFISERITGRTDSLFAEDLHNSEEQLRQAIDGRSVLVIGGAGTIGASFTRAILRFHPDRLFVVDTNENGLTELTRDLRSSGGLNVPAYYRPYPIDFGHTVFEKILRNEGPFEIVANFAAHKHVRSEKDAYSIEAMIENNVFKAKRLMDTLLASSPEHFFCVSTDKAANPVNVMGASKKLMEEVILAYSREMPVTTARFANVAFSNGSLLQGFLERMMKTQPLSSPTNVRRYFVSPEESGQLCMLACLLGDSGDIFFPRLDPSSMKRFSDIAGEFLQAYGDYRADVCATEKEARHKAAALNDASEQYPLLLFETDTSGEKEFEEFFTDDEEVDLDRFRALGIIKNTGSRTIPQIEIVLKGLRDLVDAGRTSKSDIVSHLSELIPGFEHLETGKSLDDRM